MRKLAINSTLNSSLSAYENGQRNPPLDMLIALSTFFDVTTDYLLGLATRSYSPSILNDKFVGNTSFGYIIEALGELTPKQKEAALLIIDNMRFCTKVAEQTENNRVRTE